MIGESIVLFEGTVLDSWKSESTDPASEVVIIEYPLSPINVYGSLCDTSGRITNKCVGVNDKGWFQITIPKYTGLIKGDKIQILKTNNT